MADLIDLEQTGRDLEARQRQMETLDRLSRQFGQSLSGALRSGAQNGARLDGVLASIGRTLSSSLIKSGLDAIQTGFKTGLQGLIQSAFSGASLGAFGGATPFASGGVFSRGMVMPFASGGVVSAPTYFPLGRGLGLMGERGTEAVMPLTRGPDGRLGVQANGGGRAMSVTVNVTTPDAESFRRSEAQVSAALARAVARGQRTL